VIHTTTTKFAVFDRITITLPVMKQARAIVFFMKGQEKLDVWKQMISDPVNPERWPSHDVIPGHNVTLICGL
jgi:6-phosphogluconolactonase/glucosamine-6-phosphate isomerase/deaminase